MARPRRSQQETALSLWFHPDLAAAPHRPQTSAAAPAAAKPTAAPAPLRAAMGSSMGWRGHRLRGGVGKGGREGGVRAGSPPQNAPASRRRCRRHNRDSAGPDAATGLSATGEFSQQTGACFIKRNALRAWIVEGLVSFTLNRKQSAAFMLLCD